MYLEIQRIKIHFDITQFKIANNEEKKDYPLNQFRVCNKTSGKNQQAAKWK